LYANNVLSSKETLVNFEANAAALISEVAEVGNAFLISARLGLLPKSNSTKKEKNSFIM